MGKVPTPCYITGLKSPARCALLPSPIALALFPPRRTALAAGCYALTGIRFTPKLALRCDLPYPTYGNRSMPERAGAFFCVLFTTSQNTVLKCSPWVRLMPRRPEGGEEGGIPVGPTPTLPRPKPLRFRGPTRPRRRPRVGPGRPLGSYKQTDTNNVARVSLRSGFWRRGELACTISAR